MFLQRKNSPQTRDTDVRWLRGHVIVDCRLMLGQHDNLVIDEAGHIVTKAHVHDMLKAQRLKFGRTVQMCTVHLYLFRQDVGVSYREASFCKKLVVQQGTRTYLVGQLSSPNKSTNTESL